MGKTIIFIGNARDYHAMDWYRTVRRICGPRKVFFATDLIESEGHQKIVCDGDDIIEMYNIDRLLFRKQSTAGNLWRNAVKFLLSPIQVWKIRSIAKKYPDSVFHAHTMYYMYLCWMAGIPFAGTPQGSEILVRPYRSIVYRYFARKSLNAAKIVSVDSNNLRTRILDLCAKESVVIQNGIDVAAIRETVDQENVYRTNFTSFRGMYPIYRIEEVLRGRSKSASKPPITFVYPFWEEEYKKRIRSDFETEDEDLGRISKGDLFRLFSSTLLAVSIPNSDSSPRSVYEAIFCGCCVAVSCNPWIDDLPSCMRSRLYIVDLDDEGWFEKALQCARSVTKTPFVPTREALDLFDQERTMARVVKLLYDA